MKSTTTILSLLFMFCTASAQTNNSDVMNELVKVASSPSSADLCVWISSTNKLVQIGEPAVNTLISVLQSDKYGDISKWSAALALGEIGNTKAVQTLTDVATKNPSDSHGFYLGDLSRNAIGKIKGEIKKEGKFRKTTIAVQKTVTDCESGEVKVIQ